MAGLIHYPATVEDLQISTLESSINPLIVAVEAAGNSVHTLDFLKNVEGEKSFFFGLIHRRI